MFECREQCHLSEGVLGGAGRVEWGMQNLDGHLLLGPVLFRGNSEIYYDFLFNFCCKKLFNKFYKIKYPTIIINFK